MLGLSKTKIAFLGVLLSALVPSLVLAQTFRREAPATTYSDRDFGIGIGFTGVAGLSLYKGTRDGEFVQSGLSYHQDGDFYGTADYAFGYPLAFARVPSLTPYWGVGAAVIHDERDLVLLDADGENEDSTHVGARIPLGLNWLIPSTPVQLGAEVAPSLLMVPDTFGYVQGGVHLRVML